MPFKINQSLKTEAKFNLSLNATLMETFCRKHQMSKRLLLIDVNQLLTFANFFIIIRWVLAWVRGFEIQENRVRIFARQLVRENLIFLSF